MAVIDIISDDQFRTITSSVSRETLIVIYFHTSWADPCVQMTAVFAAVSETASPKGSAIFLSIDADKFPDISESFDVSAVPYFVLVRDSTILQELSGADPKELASAVALYMNGATDAPGSPAANQASATPGTPKQAASGVQGSPATNSPGHHTDDEREETEEELNARLTKLVSAAPIMLFMKGSPAAPQCGFSRQLVAILREHHARFGFFDILKDNSVRQGLKKFSDWPTFPQLYIKGELQGGLDIVRSSVEEDPEFFEKAMAE